MESYFAAENIIPLSMLKISFFNSLYFVYSIVYDVFSLVRFNAIHLIVSNKILVARKSCSRDSDYTILSCTFRLILSTYAGPLTFKVNKLFLFLFRTAIPSEQTFFKNEMCFRKNLSNVWYSRKFPMENLGVAR